MAWADIDPGTSPPEMAIGAVRSEYELCKAIPGCNIGRDDIWRVPLTWAAWVAFSCIWQRQPVDVRPPLAEWAQRAWSDTRARLADRDALDASDPELISELSALDSRSPGLSLVPVQRGAVQWLARWRRDVLADARGNGKTPPLIRAMQVLAQTGEAFPALVTCPDSAPLSWQRKLAAWAPEIRTVIIGGPKKKREQAIAALAAGDADVGIIVWSNVRMHTRLAAYPGQAFVRCDAHGGKAGSKPSVCEVHDKEFQGFRLRLVIADEAHRMADARSKQTRALWHLMHHAETAWPVTGTLTTNDVGNLWPVLHGLDPRAWPSRSKYLDLYADQESAWSHKGVKILGLRRDTEPWFRLAVEPYFRRIPREIARAGQPGLAPPEFRYPQMTPKHAASYKSIMDQGLLELRRDTIVTPSALVKFTRLCQLAQAMFRVEDGEDPYGFSTENVRLCLPSPKVDDLMEFLAAEPGQWIVAATSPQLTGLAEGKLHDAGIPYSKIIGGMNHEAKDAAALAFQRGEARVIFITGAGSESIDLEKAQGVYWMQPDPSFTMREQMTGRADRWGQQQEVRQVWALTPGTTDIRLYQLGLDKEERHREITRDPQMLEWLMSAQAGEIIEEDHDTASTTPHASDAG